MSGKVEWRMVYADPLVLTTVLAWAAWDLWLDKTTTLFNTRLKNCRVLWTAMLMIVALPSPSRLQMVWKFITGLIA
jgi:hypothetical protein